MDRRHCGVLIFALFSAYTVRASAQSDALGRLRSEFHTPPADCRIMMRWWWFGPAVTKGELERELLSMQEAGIGGVELQPVYPLALDDPKNGFQNTPYLSEAFIDDLGFAAEKAHELGLRFDLTLGSGWPYGGPQTPVSQAAGKLRVVASRVAPGEGSSAVPNLAQGEQLLAAFVSDGPQPSSSAKMLDIRMIRNGRIGLDPTTATRSIEWFISSRTGMMVKRAAVGAEGFVLDHFDQSAIENHLHTVGDRLLSAFRNHPPYSVFSDSLEVYDSDWTADLLQEFKKRRSYDLLPLLPALVRDIGSQTPEIRHDWGETLTELIDERYLTPIREWARQHDTRFRSQTYGIPAVSLSSNSLVDLPEGEGDNWQAFSPSRWASSASHLYGRNVTSAETWTWLHSPAFRATPLDMKADADRFFLEGINQIVGHGWPYSPPGIPEPGWSFYAAGAFNDHNPWWPVMPELAVYLQRISFLLRQGEPVRDVALLVPTDDAWAQFSVGHDSLSETIERLLGPQVIPQLIGAGFNVDFIDAEAISKVGIPYRALVLPSIELLSPTIYAKIRDYAQNGGIVVATRVLPSQAPGKINSAEDASRVPDISRELFQVASARGVFVADENNLGAVLTERLEPDVVLSPPMSNVGFVHRRLPFADVYFLANSSSRKIAATAAFRTRMSSAESWDPLTGTVSSFGHLTRVQLELAPYQSRVFVFSDEPQSTASNSLPREQKSISPLDLSGGWTVTFPALKRTFSMAQLHSWSGADATRYYSGPAEYEKSFTFASGSGGRIYLDFGDGTPTEQRDKHSRFFAGLEAPIREAAKVFVNEHFAGSVWNPPYRLDVTNLLQPGENRLRIVVYNTAMNELAGRVPPDYRLLNSRYGVRFSQQDVEDIKPLPSGLTKTPRLLVEH